MENVNSAEKRFLGFGLSFAAGFASFAAQIIFLRESLSLLPSNELVLALYFTFYLLWAGLGAVLWEKVNYRLLFLLIGPLFFLSLFSVRIILPLARPSPGALPSLWFYIVVFLILGGFSSISGGFFSSLTRAFASPSLVYGADSLGSFLASLVLYLLLLPQFHSFSSAALSFAFFSLLIFLLGLRKEAIITLLFLLVLPFLDGPTWGRLFRPLRVEQVLESPYGKITLTEYQGQRTLWENSEKLYDFPPAPSEKLALLSLVPGGRKIALIGGGGRCLRYLRKIKGLKILYAEPDPVLSQLARRFFPSEGVDFYRGDGVKMVNNMGENYDLLILDLPPPSSSSSMRFYTMEFFQRASRHFSRLSLALPGGQYFSDADSKILASVYASLKTAYPHVVFVPGEKIFMMASKEKIEITPEAYRKFLEEKGIEPEFYLPVQMEFELNPLLVRRTKEALSGGKAIVSSNPITYLYSLVKWLRHYFPSFPIPESSPWFLLPLLFLIPGIILRKEYLMGVISFSAFSLEILYLLLFQFQFGNLYLQVSLFVGLLMAFLGLGSLFLRKRASLLILLLISALPLALKQPPAWFFYLAFPLLGAGEGGIFGYLAHRVRSPSKMFLWDLLGSSLAGFLLGLLYIPIFGFKIIFALVSLLILLSL